MHAFFRTYLPYWPIHRPPISGVQYGKVGAMQYLLLAIKISEWPTQTVKAPQPRVTLSCNFVNRAHGHPGGAGYRQGWVASASMW